MPRVYKLRAKFMSVNCVRIIVTHLKKRKEREKGRKKIFHKEFILSLTDKLGPSRNRSTLD